MPLIRNATFPGRFPGERREMTTTTQRAAPSAEQDGLEGEMLAFLARTRMGKARFCAELGQSGNNKTGLFVKAREGRLHDRTVLRVRAFMKQNQALSD